MSILIHRSIMEDRFLLIESFDSIILFCHITVLGCVLENVIIIAILVIMARFQN